MSSPARSAIWNGPIGQPKSAKAASIPAGVAPSSSRCSSSAERAASMRLPTKPWQTPTTTGTLPMPLGQRERGGEDVGRRCRAAHDLDQPHHMRRREEVQAHHVARSAGRRRDLVEVEIGGVGGEHRAGLGDAVQPRKHRPLGRHVLEHRLDDQVALARLAKSVLPEISPRRRSRSAWLNEPRETEASSVRSTAAKPRSSASRLISTSVAGRPALASAMRDAAAHGAGADDADPVQRSRYRLLAEPGDLRRPPVRRRTGAAAPGFPRWPPGARTAPVRPPAPRRRAG